VILLDLFCGAGGAAMGYYRAGFDVVGVDIKPQPHYPFHFHQADALEFSAEGYDVVHASPPCQSYSKSVSIENRKKHPDLVARTRELLRATGLPYVIENVPGAPLLNPVQLCGSAFGLPIRRHRLFETTFPLLSPGCIHGAYERKYPAAWNRTTPLRVLSISGGYQKRQLSEDFMEQHKAAMGIDWDISYNELSEAIPPAYTRFIGEQWIAMESTKHEAIP
jgi:DNA (cytosine-5)-methyltransferase 1